MNTLTLLADNLKSELATLKWHLDDFSDADFYVRPAPAANHALWQVGHVLSSTASMLVQVDSSFQSPLPEKLTAPFKQEGSSRVDDPTKFPTPAELRAGIDQLAAAAGAWVAGLSTDVLPRPSPEWAKDWAPTMGRLLISIGTHVAMHYGQIQAIRRLLGKKNLM